MPGDLLSSAVGERALYQLLLPFPTRAQARRVGALVVMRSTHAANISMHKPTASREYRNGKDRLLLAVFGPTMVLGILMFVIAAIAQLIQIVGLL